MRESILGLAASRVVINTSIASILDTFHVLENCMKDMKVSTLNLLESAVFACICSSLSKHCSINSVIYSTSDCYPNYCSSLLDQCNHIAILHFATLLSLFFPDSIAEIIVFITNISLSRTCLTSCRNAS